jgi:predicted transcriptional regulator
MRLISNDWPYLLPDQERSTLAAYALWLLWGLLGAHRLYLGKPLSALLYLGTSAFLGIGWLYDLITLPQQVEWFRLRRRLAELGGAETPGDLSRPLALPRKRPLRGPEEIMMALLRFARQHQGSVSVTEGVMETGAPFKKVERVLREMLQSGYVDVVNDPESGTVRYLFPELAPTRTEPERPR